MAQVACAQIEMAGMVAENMQRQATGKSMAYDEQAFSDVILEYKIGWNDVLNFFKKG